uniref:Ig-like domain-containing protein n=1 Tax=Poecilia formosa TaxID=48698 RepID=A0A087X3B1_POEFO
MELLSCVSLCLLTFIGKTFGDEIGIKIYCKEDEDVILPCSCEETLTTKRFDWKKDEKDVFLCVNGEVSPSSQDKQFRGRVIHFPHQLNSGNASISIKKAKVSDSGNYTCLCIDSAKSYNIELTVGTCPKPTIKSVEELNNGVKVQCEVHGAFLQPTMELQNSANVTIDAENTKCQNGNYCDIILQAVVTKKDFYHCVVKQEEICHQIYSEKTLVLMPSESMNRNGGEQMGLWKVAFIGVVVGIIVIAVVLFYCLYWRKRNWSGKIDGKTKGQSSAGNQQDAGTGMLS